MTRGKHTKDNEHITALEEHMKAGHEFEQPIGVVNRLLEAAGAGTFTWPTKISAQKLQDSLHEVVFNSTFETKGRESALTLYELGVRVKGTHAA